MSKEEIKKEVIEIFNYLNSKRLNFDENISTQILFTRRNPLAFPKRTRAFAMIGNSQDVINWAKINTPNAYKFNNSKYPKKRRQMYEEKPKQKSKVGEKIRGAINKVTSNTSLTFNAGSAASKGFVPLILASGAVLFLLTQFGGLFSKRR